MKNSIKCLKVKNLLLEFILLFTILSGVLATSVLSNQVKPEKLELESSIILQAKGSETGRPIPRYVSLKSEKVNMRRGPGKEFQIDWVYYRKHLPVKVILEYEEWRKIEDFEGFTGWVHTALLSGKKSLIVVDNAPLKIRPKDDSLTLVHLKRNVLLEPNYCEQSWCKVKIQKYSGWINKKFVWGGF